MDIVIIGSGNVAAVLGRKFKAAGHTILQVYSRNASAASLLAYEWDTESTNYKSLINPNADVYLVAVTDDGIKDVITDILLPGKVIAHTAASVPKEALKSVSAHYGVFYPLQSLRKEMAELPEIPFIIDANTPDNLAVIEEFALSMKGPVKIAGDEERMKLHFAAVMVSNFTNHMYALTDEYCRREKLPFDTLQPLIVSIAERLRWFAPAAVQTGPAIRHDAGTIEKHLALLNEYPELKMFYASFTKSIEKMYP